MLLRKPLPLWINVSLFAGAAAMIPLAGQLRRQPVSTPATIAELSERLRRCTPRLHFVPQFPDRAELPMWVCAGPQSREQLWGLICDPERVKKGQWHGIVLCKGTTDFCQIPDEFIRDSWGEYGMRIGRFVFFGDPDLLQRIREAIFDYSP